MEPIWLKSYPPGVPAAIELDRSETIPRILARTCEQYPDRPAFANLGCTISFRELDRLSQRFAAYLQRELGLVRGERGASGGYELTRPAEEITAQEIVSAMEGGLGLLDCVARPAICQRSATCAARRLWTEAGRAMGNVLASTSLADLRDDQRAANGPSPPRGGVACAAPAPTGATPRSRADGARG